MLEFSLLLHHLVLVRCLGVLERNYTRIISVILFHLKHVKCCMYCITQAQCWDCLFSGVPLSSHSIRNKTVPFLFLAEWLWITTCASVSAGGRIFLDRKLSRPPRVSFWFSDRILLLSFEKIKYTVRGLSDKFPSTLGPMIQYCYKLKTSAQLD